MKNSTQVDGMSIEGMGLQEHSIPLGGKWEIRLERHVGIGVPGSGGK